MTDTPTPTPTVSGYYGEPPQPLGAWDFSAEWTEFMHYQYIPVRLPYHDAFDTSEDTCVTLPANLEFLHDIVLAAIRDAEKFAPHLADPYVYVTAKRGYATPGNPLNRPGWHTDDFGGTDLNYIWSDRYPSQFLTSPDPLSIPADDTESMNAMMWLARHAGWDRGEFGSASQIPLYPRLLRWTGAENTLNRLTPFTIHNTPDIHDGGGMRSFLKISVSTHRYDLVGNSHNHLMTYDWPMHERDADRNQPSAALREVTADA